MIKKYRKKPVVVEAIQYTKDNYWEINEFIKGSSTLMGIPDTKGEFDIATLEGNMTVKVGDYIIKGIKGEFYPCKPDIFELTYEEV